MTHLGGQPKVLLAYFPLHREPPLLQFFSSLHRQGRVVCMPLEHKGTPAITVWDGIQMPSKRGLQNGSTYTGPLDVAIIPGLLFTKQGVRLGHGGGWYDRLLSKHNHVHSIGVAHEKQCVEELPVEEHDRVMDLVALI